ncbi:LacI family DNA-binding transcriptional regulator [Allokutzneria multivorans]|uniref:LacI family DNA-binding transcriptional regulator n=1 Tax=Allokutzneria multivorans TaxID=1142134 RepID=UPI0031EDE911
MRRPAAPPTLEDVAVRAGVSRATVSRVINKQPRVSPETAAVVLSAAAELGYTPNAAARSLVTRRTGAVAVVLSEPESMIFDDPFFAAVVRTACTELARNQQQMALLLAHRPEQAERVERFLRAGHVDGVLMFSPHRDDPLPDQVRRLPVPVVFGGRPWLPEDGLHIVDADNLGGAELATRHLLDRGRSNTVTITGPLDHRAAVDRLEGWRQVTGADQDAVRLLSAEGDFTRRGGERAMAELLDRVPDLDGVFAASDHMAVGALHVLQRAGRAVPHDVSVVSFDDHPSIAASARPALTAVRQDPVGMVAEMVANLRALLDGEDLAPACRILPATLTERSST